MNWSRVAVAARIDGMEHSRCTSRGFLLLGTLLLAGSGCTGSNRSANLPIANSNLSTISTFARFPQSLPKSTISAPKPPLPSVHSIVVLPVPFTPQAPFANWDVPHEEACEEASMLMAAEYFKHNPKLRLDPAYADEQILQLEAWETKKLGYYEDTTAAEVVSILKTYFGLSTELIPYDPVLMRRSIDEKKLIILPTAGRLLGNPHFRAPGPLYHMLVVRGYQGDEFIVNDPGTKYGESYRYKQSVLTNAVHDFNGADTPHGARVMVVVGAP